MYVYGYIFRVRERERERRGGGGEEEEEEFCSTKPRILPARRDKKYMQNVFRNTGTLRLFGRHSKGMDSNIKT